ncbi:DTX [Mytilus edulis]|uniref:E3 ubiquitin-protein ligase n=1 Tax=Mytilus edulis TaxID=6550 RepID=A0A8S3PM82_MYTED|nr:DTX [Mytilus edulis]
MKSIALPFVSTGISPIPKDMCTKEYCKAIEEYSRIRNNTSSLLEIYFVDKNYALISLIRQEFAKAFIKSGKRYVSKQEPGRQNLKPFSKAQTYVQRNYVSELEWIVETQKSNEPTCPQCGGIQGILTGIQPQGRMETNIKSSSLCGFPGTDTIEIVYVIPSGIQGAEHPHPGRLFEGITRRAYLPNNTKGQTTGKTGVIWNDISHKTNPEPNAAFGFPDDTYFDRVLDDLGFKGVTEKDIEP